VHSKANWTSGRRRLIHVTKTDIIHYHTSFYKDHLQEPKNEIISFTADAGPPGNKIRQ